MHAASDAKSISESVQYRERTSTQILSALGAERFIRAARLTAGCLCTAIVGSYTSLSVHAVCRGSRVRGRN